MEQKLITIKRIKPLSILHSAREKLMKKNGSIVFLTGETGYGKSTLLRVFESEAQSQEKALISMASCQAPVGTMQIAALQPLGPFLRLIEEMKSVDKVMTPQKKLALNIGMTLLTSVPYFGDLIDAVKEINRDVQLYKSEKDQEQSKEDKSEKKDLYLEFYKTLEQWSAKTPLVLILDDMHWCDAESALLIDKIAENISKLPIMLVVSFRKSVAEESLSPLLSVLRKCKDDGVHYYHAEVGTFTKDELHELCIRMLRDYKYNSEFEEILYDKTAGIPSVTSEYVRYFTKVTPFLPDGSISEEFKRGDLLPSSIHAAFSALIENLNEEEIMLLSLCAAEGVESSAFIISKLLNTDIVTAIRKIKRIQAKTGVIKSLGPHDRYGVKTTLFEFTQTFYREYFERSLEYEEKTAIHSQMLNVLNEQAEGMDDIQRSLITPYIAAHANGAGEKEVMQHALLEIANTSQHMSMPALSGYALKAYDTGISQSAENPTIDMTLSRARIGAELNENYGVHIPNAEQAKINAEQPEVEEQLHDVVKPDSSATEREILVACEEGRYEDAIKIGNEFLGLHAGSLVLRDEAMLSLLMARINITVQDLKTANIYIKEVQSLQKKVQDAIIDCLLDNTLATYHMQTNNIVSAWQHLQKAAKSSGDIGREYQLLTITNISTLLEKSSKSEAVKFKKAAKNLAKALKMTSLVKGL